jgi:hypothetical protein
VSKDQPDPSDEIERLATAIREAVGGSLSPATTELAPAAQYDDMASWFDEQCINGFYNAHYDRPAVLALIGAAAGQRILDVGWGVATTSPRCGTRAHVSWVSTAAPSCSAALGRGWATRCSSFMAT